MVENKSIIEQLNKFELMVEQLRSSGVTLDENYIVASLIDKLPPSCSSHVHNLNHIQGELTLNFVLNSIRIEEKNRTKEKKEEKQPIINNLKGNSKSKKNQNRNNFNKKEDLIKDILIIIIIIIIIELIIAKIIITTTSVTIKELVLRGMVGVSAVMCVAR